MFLIQLLLPARDNHEQPIDGALFAQVRQTLADRFGGVTAYQRSPASGLWKRPDGGVDGDDVVMVEVEVEALDREWWGAFRRQLEHDFKQETILARAIPIEKV
ncbi:MAG: hypothetical protein JWL71_4760 [Acidobacteria bacterium]|nr:hypothetical protein [Acidobacteriota bacterium]